MTIEHIETKRGVISLMRTAGGFRCAVNGVHLGVWKTREQALTVALQWLEGSK